jgi:hypothetical protein
MSKMLYSTQREMIDVHLHVTTATVMVSSYTVNGVHTTRIPTTTATSAKVCTSVIRANVQ